DPPENLVARDMGPVRYVACMTPAYAEAHGVPRALTDLAEAPVITSAVMGRELRLAATLHGERHEVPLRPTLTSENFLFLREAIVA
ncbi:LysR substrate-binding domain-containing protein, partial [Proteus terrae]|uniref:LysR substrate-binding domain-containing protein n=1 Tax=Proteus terrae TaxID=1574161 RepID=UPI0035284191